MDLRGSLDLSVLPNVAICKNKQTNKTPPFPDSCYLGLLIGLLRIGDQT